MNPIRGKHISQVDSFSDKIIYCSDNDGGVVNTIVKMTT